MESNPVDCPEKILDLDQRVILMNAQPSFRDGIRLTATKRNFEQATRTKLQRGKMYAIAAEAEGVGVFKTHHIGSTRPTVYLHVPKRLAGNVRTGKKYLMTINSVQERRDYNVTNTSHGPTVRVFKTNMELMGFRPARGMKQKIVVEFRGVNVTRPTGASEKRLFTTYKLGLTQVDLRVGRLGARPGDVFEFNQIRQFSISDFAREFNAHKSQFLRNVTMFFRPRSLLLRVDGKKIALTQPRLTTNKLEVALRADIGRTKKPVKFQFDGEKIIPRFLQDWPIHKMKASPYGFEIDYSLGKNNARSFRLNFDKFNRAHLLGRLKLLSAPDNVEGTYRVETDHFLRECVRFRIASASARSYDEFRYEKGDISEEIQRYLLDTTGLWEEVAYHPFENGWRAHESRKTGPDSLQRFKVSGELYYFEFKWDKHWELTHQVARHQAMKYIIEHPRYESEKIAGAYIGILHWDTAANKLKLHVSRVWPPNQNGRGTHEML